MSSPVTLSQTADARQSWVLACGSRYWSRNPAAVAQLAMPETSYRPQHRFRTVALPDWARDLGVGRPESIMVDDACIAAAPGDEFARCNWIAACYFFLTGAAEPDDRHDSYSGLMLGFDPRVAEHAWVNRIFLLLRRMAARQAQTTEGALFGALPDPDIVLTHDVDAVVKTPEIRLKQTAFHLVNAAQALGCGRARQAANRAALAVRFLATTPAYDRFSEICALEEAHGKRSLFHFYGGPAGWARGSFVRLLIDPAYEIASPSLRAILAALRDGGWQIGAHFSYESWNDEKGMRAEKEALERASQMAVIACRQHWLRFSWKTSWRLQAAAGFSLDSTLGFNDRPGFRHGAALRFHPWDEAQAGALGLQSLPMVLMDSHFYDYALMGDDERHASIASWIDEIRAVRGEASINWHVHTLAPDYGWADGYRYLLSILP